MPKPASGRDFYIATADEIRAGRTTDIYCGLEEVVHLLQGKAVSLWAIPEGSAFPAKTPRGIPVPVMVLEGPYGDWAMYETPVLGMICQASGIATKAARIRKAAG